MFKEIFAVDLLQWFTRVSLLLFLVVFASTLIWAYTRSRREVSKWSSMALDDDDASMPSSNANAGNGGAR